MRVGLALALVVVLEVSASAQETSPVYAPGWTGLTRPSDVTSARQRLMMEIERLMRPVDALAGGEQADPTAIRTAATSVAAMLSVVPHLFPPTTNLYSDDSATPTLALPAIWQHFAAFEQSAAASVAAAEALAAAPDDPALRAAAMSLRATCDGCHAPYLRPYVPEKVRSEDLDFDFDSVLPQN